MTKDAPLEALDIIDRFVNKSSMSNEQAEELDEALRIVRAALKPCDQLAAFKAGKVIVNGERLVEVQNGVQYASIYVAHRDLEPITQGDSLHFTEKRYQINDKIYAFMWSIWPSIYEVIPA